MSGVFLSVFIPVLSWGARRYNTAVMKTRDILKESWLSVSGNKMRSFLTVLGIVIGVMAVVVMVAVGETVRHQITDQFSGLGTNTMMVRAGAANTGGVRTGNRQTLTLDDADVIHRLPDVVAITPIQGTSAQIIYGNQNWSTSLVGVGPEMPDVQTLEMEYGMFFDADAMHHAKTYAIVGPTTAEELGLPENPVGETIRIGNMPFVIIGVPKPRGDSAIGSQDDMVMIPVTTLRKRVQGSRFPNSVNAIAIKLEPKADSGVVTEQIVSILRQRHRLKDNDPDDFQIMDMRQIMEAMNRVTGYMQMLLISIAAVSLIVGAIGIMNMMLVSVAERTREIGIRKAIGAREKQIIIQFLSESILISFIGSMAGLLIGVGLSQGVGRFVLGYVVPFSVWPVILSVSVAVIVGLASGVVPALKAAKLNPIDSLRHE